MYRHDTNPTREHELPPLVMGLVLREGIVLGMSLNIKMGMFLIFIKS